MSDTATVDHPFPFEHPAKTHRQLDVGNEQYIFDFANGYGASVIRGPYTYGGPELWELGVLNAGGGLTYSTPITDDVIGHLDEQAVAATLDRICRLEARR